jgi:lysophospholipase L1-like esterase
MFRIQWFDCYRKFTLLRTLLIYFSSACGVWAAFGGLSPVVAQSTSSAALANPNPNNFDAVKIIQAIETPHSDLVVIVAHRGLHALAGTTQAPAVPENSLQSIGVAAQAGWEAVELDVRMTSDNVPILTHDRSWGREWCGTANYPYSNVIYDPFVAPGKSSVNDSVNPPVADTSLGNTRSFLGQTELRLGNVLLVSDKKWHGCSEWIGFWGVYPPTLEDALNYVRDNHIHMVLSLDIQSISAAQAAWTLVQSHQDSDGKSFALSTIFKMPAGLFPRGSLDFAHAFPNYQNINYMPVILAKDIEPADGDPLVDAAYPYTDDYEDGGDSDVVTAGLGGEQGIINWLNTFGPLILYPEAKLAGVEVVLKQSGGILQTVVAAARTKPGTTLPQTVGNFNPVGDYYPPDNSNTNQTPNFFVSKDGHCCYVLSNYWFNNPDGTGPKDPSLPMDTADNRTSLDFIVGTGNQFVTTDDPNALGEYLTSNGLNKHNITYMQADGGAAEPSNVAVVSLDVSPVSPSPGMDVQLSVVLSRPSATGTVTFYEDGQILGTVSVNRAFAAFTVPAIAAGGHTFTATYSGDSTYLSGQSNTDAVGSNTGVRPNVTQLVVLPLGDSITWGSETPPGTAAGNGYRGYLQTELSAEGYSVRYVGSQSSGNLPNPQNEGHPGYRIDQIAALTNAALATYNPNVVLLLAGTNDMNQGYQVSTAPDRLGALIDQIVAAAPGAVVLVASLPPSAYPATETNIVAFNAQIPGVVQARRNAGAKVQFVDMGGLTAADLSDLLHPNDSGYQKMANAWNSAVIDVSLLDMIQAAGAGAGGQGHTPGPVGGAPTAAAQTFLGEIATGVGAPKGSKILLADLNGDGRTDYVVVDRTTGALTAWLNGGPNQASPPSWLWWPQGVIASGVAPGATVQLADINGDGRVDYLVVDPVSGAVQAWLNGGPNPAGGDWYWFPQGTIASGVAPGSTVQFADVNGDGLADYLVVDPTSGAVQVWLNGGPNPAGGQYFWYPQGTVAAGVLAPPGSQVIFADINHDGYADYLSVSSVNGSIKAWLNLGGTSSNWGWLPLGQLSPGAGAPTSRLKIFAVDLNADGRADVLALNVATGSIQAWQDNGLDATAVSNWVFEGNTLTGVGLSGAAWNIFADLNGDGLADYAIVSPTTNAISPAYLNEGSLGAGASGVIQSSWGWARLGTIASGVTGGAIQLADVDGDGSADYLIIDNSTGAVQAYLNGGPNPSGGDWLWIPQGKIASGTPASSNPFLFYVQFADLNGDGKADYLIVSQADGSVQAYLNGGPDAFGGDWLWFPQGTIATGVGADPATTTLRFADINGDGRADYLVVNNITGAVQAWLNGGPNPSGGWIWYPQGQITAGLGSTPSGQIHNVIFADINGDGRADYLLVQANGDMAAWLMNGGDTGIPAQRAN